MKILTQVLFLSLQICFVELSLELNLAPEKIEYMCVIEKISNSMESLELDKRQCPMPMANNHC